MKKSNKLKLILAITICLAAYYINAKVLIPNSDTGGFLLYEKKYENLKVSDLWIAYPLDIYTKSFNKDDGLRLYINVFGKNDIQGLLNLNCKEKEKSFFSFLIANDIPIPVENIKSTIPALLIDNAEGIFCFK